MAYCVKCGVRLKQSEIKCPLCNTKVENAEVEPIYSPKVEYFSKRVNLIYFCKLITMILFSGAVISMIVNLSVSKTLNWSLYVLFGVIYICGHFLYLFLKHKKTIFIINILNLELLLFVIAKLTIGLSWYLNLVLPIILMCAIFILFLILLLKSPNKNILRHLSYILLYIAVSLFALNGLINLYSLKAYFYTWSVYSNIPIISISAILFILSFSKRILLEVEKRVFL